MLTNERLSIAMRPESAVSAVLRVLLVKHHSLIGTKSCCNPDVLQLVSLRVSKLCCFLHCPSWVTFKRSPMKKRSAFGWSHPQNIEVFRR